MGSNYVVTITREFGSLGRPIARKLSELLGIEFCDRDIIDETAREMNLPVSYISRNEENIGGVYAKMRFPLGRSSVKVQDELFSVQSEIILRAASRESCVIVGRCSDYVLRDFTRRLSVHVFAPYEARLENCIKVMGLDRETAEEMIPEVDKARQAYEKRYAGYTPSDLKNQHLMIDSSYFGVEGTAQLIAGIVQERFLTAAG